MKIFFGLLRASKLVVNQELILVRSDDIMVVVLDGIFVSSGCSEHF